MIKTILELLAIIIITIVVLLVVDSRKQVFMLEVIYIYACWANEVLTQFIEEVEKEGIDCIEKDKFRF